MFQQRNVDFLIHTKAAKYNRKLNCKCKKIEIKQTFYIMYVYTASADMALKTVFSYNAL